MIRSSAGMALISALFSSFSSWRAVRNRLLMRVKSELRFVAWVNCSMNGRKSRSVFCNSLRSFSGTNSNAFGQHLQIALVDYVGEQIRFGFQPRSEPLDELTIFLHQFAFHHHHQIVLRRKLFLKLQEILMILLVRTDEVIATGVELKFFDRESNAEQKNQNLRIQEKPRPRANRPGQAAQQSGRY